MKQKAWSEFGWQIAGGVLALVVVALVIATGLLTVDEIKQGKKLQGVGVAGPCRAFGIGNDECQKQARRIFAACYVQQEECREKYGLELVRVRDNQTRRDVAGDLGGGAPTGSTGSLLPGPRNGGSGGGDGSGKQRGGGDGGSGGRGKGKPSPAPAPVPDPQTVPSGSAPSSSPGRSGNAPGNPEPKPSSPGTVPSTVEGVGKAVEDTGAAVGGVVKEAGESVNDGADCALRGSC